MVPSEYRRFCGGCPGAGAAKRSGRRRPPQRHCFVAGRIGGCVLGAREAVQRALEVSLRVLDVTDLVRELGVGVAVLDCLPILLSGALQVALDHVVQVSQHRVRPSEQPIGVDELHPLIVLDQRIAICRSFSEGMYSRAAK